MKTEFRNSKEDKEKWFDISLLSLYFQEPHSKMFANSLFAGRRIDATSARHGSKSFFA